MNLIRNLRYLSNSLANIKNNKKMKINKMPDIINSKEEAAPLKAACLLKMGYVIAVPTDTIYGLACSANCPKAIKKLYEIKGRDSVKPVAICVSSISDVRKWGKATHLTDELLYSLLPGPVTVVLERTESLDNPYLNPHTTKIGIRIPKHNFINTMTQMFDQPVALTSANFSNEPSSLSIVEFEKLYDRLGAVFDGGVLSQGKSENRSGSTVIDLSKTGYYNVIRKGISYENIVQILQNHGFLNAS